jgi:hypothetical protein
VQSTYRVHHSSFAFSFIHMKYAQQLNRPTSSGKYRHALYLELFEKEFSCKVISNISYPISLEYELQFNTNKDMTAFLLRFS